MKTMKDGKRNEKPAPPADDERAREKAYQARQKKMGQDWEKMRADLKAQGLHDPY